jgi:HAD superfamily hydrolase (TIGR01509 family)
MHYTIFLDDGDVMNDNAQRGPQWQRLIGDFFSPRLGGMPEAWREANREVMTHFFDGANWRQRAQAARDYNDFERTYQLDWLGQMCELVGIPCPPEDECHKLARAAESYIPPHVHSAYPGVVEAIRTLHQQGHTLYTASGEASYQLDGYLRGMGVRECFTGRLYGPDLINTLKDGPDYYERIFADSHVDPATAIFVDDKASYLRYAAQSGARTIQILNAPLDPLPEDLHAAHGITWRIRCLAELPNLLASPEVCC